VKQKTYKQILQELTLPSDTPKTLPCKMCGGTLHQIRVNPYVCFWTHKGDADNKKCAEANNVFKKPVIATSINWTGNKIMKLWSEMHDPQNKS